MTGSEPESVRPLMIAALERVDFTCPLPPEDAELLFNSTVAERRAVAALHASAADALLRQATALDFAATMLRRWWDRPGATLRSAVEAAPRELAETVLARLQAAGWDVDLLTEPPPDQPA